MARVTLIAELATNFGGDLELAKDMIRAAADAGADIVKTQGYQIRHLRKSDPQYEWFAKCELSEWQHRELKGHAERCGVRYLSTAFHPNDLDRLYGLGCEVKVGSGEGRGDLARRALEMGFSRVYRTLPWGVPTDVAHDRRIVTLGTVPIYPAPPETYFRVRRAEGYSDHHVGLDVAKIAIAQGATVIEKHFHIPDRGCREQPWNMTPDDLRELRRWAEVCAQALTGTRFEGRWCA